MLYITHRMEEIRRLGDQVTVLRDGRQIVTHGLDGISDDEMIRAMVGRALQSFYPEIVPKPGKEALRLENVSIVDTYVQDVSLVARHGEIVGIGGLLGSGKKEIGRVVFGLSRASGGSILFNQTDFAEITPEAALRSGCVFLPQDRRGEALLMNRSMGENIQTELLDDPSFRVLGLLKTKRLEAFTEELIRRLNIRPRDASFLVEALSGGNQQKVVLARAISIERSLYIFEEPTAGVDVGARMDFYNQLKQLCEAGAAVLLITSDLQELINMSSRIYVMHAGKISVELRGDERTEENVAAAAFGQPRGEISGVHH
jgi:ribose transport system ATP-binding protein